jgi:N-acyl-D-amino-acid deacylase
MKDRGMLRAGAFADLVLFDPETVIDTATYTAPKTPARGIEEVWVNGVSAYRGGQGVTGAGAGRLVQRQAG